jgi:hypothetical protein
MTAPILAIDEQMTFQVRAFPDLQIKPGLGLDGWQRALGKVAAFANRRESSPCRPSQSAFRCYRAADCLALLPLSGPRVHGSTSSSVGATCAIDWYRGTLSRYCVVVEIHPGLTRAGPECASNLQAQATALLVGVSPTQQEGPVCVRLKFLARPACPRALHLSFLPSPTKASSFRVTWPSNYVWW